MYLNLKLISDKGLELKDVLNLQLIHQNKTEDMSSDISSFIFPTEIEKYSQNGYIEYIKPKKKGQRESELIRLSDKGKNLLDNIQIPIITADTLKIFEWVKNIYITSGKEIGNAKKCKLYIEEFSKESGIYQNELAILIKTFLDDEKEFEYSQKMEFLFYKGSSVFSVKFDLAQSRLYQYYQKKKEYFDRKFAELK